MTTSPLVTVVVPVRDERADIGACLDSIRTQSERRLEVLVVDGGSRDGTREVVARVGCDDPRVRLVDNPAGGIPQALNIGLTAAAADWLVRVDAHSTIPSDYVDRALAHLRTGRWGGVGGRKVATAQTPTGRAIASALGSRFGVGNSTYHHGTRRCEVDHVPFGAYPVALLRRLGGWDETIPANEDFEMDYRIRRSGHRLLFDPTLRIDWQCRETVGRLFEQYRRYGRGKAQVAVKHPRSLHLRHVLPPLLVGYLAGAVLAATRWPRAALGVAPYLGAVVAGSLPGGLRLREPAAARALPAAFMAMHLGWGIGLWQGLAESVRGRRPSAESRRRLVWSTLYFPLRPAWAARVRMIDRSHTGSLRLAARLVTARQPRLLVLDGAGASVSASSDVVVAALLRLRSRPPHVVMTDCTWGTGESRLSRRVRRSLVRLIDPVVARYCVLSASERETFHRTWGVATEKVRLTPAYFTIPEQLLDVPERHDGSVFCGGDSLRDHATLLTACVGLEAPVVVATQNPARALAGRRPPPGVAVHTLAENEYLEALQRASVVVVPLRPGTVRSAGQQTYLSAMALGKPVVVTRAPGVEEYVEHDKTGWLVEPGDADGLRARLRWVLDVDHRPVVDAVRYRAQQEVRSRFGPDGYVASLLDVIEEVC